MIALTPFLRIDPSSGMVHPVRRGYASAFATALAVQHLNDGEGSLIPDVDGLRCNSTIHFTLEYINTNMNLGTALMGLAARLEETPHRPPPCVFLGPFLSIVAEPTGIVTNLHGYPQSTGFSTSERLDDIDELPLFSRTTPSNRGHATALMTYFRTQLHMTHVAVIYVRDAYGHHYLDSIYDAARDAEHEPGRKKFHIQPYGLKVDGSNVDDVMQFIQAAGYRYIFVALYGPLVNDHILMQRAIHYNLTRAKHHITWIFGDILNLETLRFNASIPADRDLIDAYRGTQFLTADGSGSYANKTQYTALVQQLQQMKQQELLFSTSANTTATNASSSSSSISVPPIRSLLHSMPETYNTDRNYLVQFLDDLLRDETFLHPDELNYAIPFIYESVIMSGLAICNGARTTTPAAATINTTHDDNTNDADDKFPLFIDGQTFQDQMLQHTTIQGISGTVLLDPITGTRLPNSTYYTMQHLQIDDDDKAIQGDENGMVHFQFEDIAQIDPLQNWTWITLKTTELLPDLPPVQELPSYIAPGMKIVAYVFCFSSMAFAVLLGLWTHRHRNTRIIASSQPFFLYILLSGVIIFAATIIPYSLASIEDQVAAFYHDIADNTTTREDYTRTTIACTSFVWLLVIGLTTVFSALYSKAYRIYTVVKSAKKFRKITVRPVDVILPMTLLLFVNVLILSVMTVFDPIPYKVIVESWDQFHRPEMTTGRCMFSKSSHTKYLAPLILVDGGMLFLAIFYGWKCRHLDTEFQEHEQILKALFVILLVSFIGGPVYWLAIDNPNVSMFLLSGFIFISCFAILLQIFWPKYKHMKARAHESLRFEINAVHKTNAKGATSSELTENADEAGVGDRILSTQKSRRALVEENHELRKRQSAMIHVSDQ